MKEFPCAWKLLFQGSLPPLGHKLLPRSFPSSFPFLQKREATGRLGTVLREIRESFAEKMIFEVTNLEKVHRLNFLN